MYVYMSKLLKRQANNAPIWCFLEAVVVDQGERALFISSETAFHLLSCFFAEYQLRSCRLETAFVVGLGKGGFDFLVLNCDLSSSVTFHYLELQPHAGGGRPILL